MNVRKILREKLERQIFDEASKSLNDADARYLAEQLASMSVEERERIMGAAFIARCAA